MKKISFNSWRRLSAELKRRNFYSVVVAYSVFAFIVLQIGEITITPLGLPNWVMVTLIVLLILGFPVLALLVWWFDFSSFDPKNKTNHLPTTVNDDQKPSIAVLPFADMSSEQNQGYFCEGIAEEILNALTKIEQLSVAARSSSFQYSASSGDVRQIGKELSVNTLLEGSVRKSDNRIRVTAQLVKTSDGYHIWSNTFDEELSDIFAIQDAIAKSIAESLLLSFSSSEQSLIKTTTTDNVGAYEYYLRGRQFFKRFRKMDIEYAIQMFRQAIKLDADYSLAWAGLADCYSFLIMYSDPQPSYKEESTKASIRALKLSSNLAEPHASRGLSYLVCNDFELAENEFKKAIELNPNLFDAYYFYGRSKVHQGQTKMAAKLFKKASLLDPADYQSRCLRIQILQGLGRTEEAVKEAHEAINVIKKHLEWYPDDSRAYYLGSGSLIITGDKETAKLWLERSIQISPNDSAVLYNAACNYSVLGEVDEAFEFLERAIKQGTINSAWMQNDEDLANLHDSPRYQQLLNEAIKTEQATLIKK